jgi:hypothetical protein
MFIDPLRGALALRQEGHVETGGEALSQLAKKAILTFQVHASRAEHGPPEGGRETLLLAAINMALLAEGKKSKLPSSAELTRPKATSPAFDHPARTEPDKPILLISDFL